MPPRKTDTARRPRWWMLGALAVLVASALLWNGLVREASGQRRVVDGAKLLALGGVLYLVWALALSRLRPVPRALAVVLPLAAAGTLAALVEVRGVTGDLVPILGWRFAPQRELESAPVTAAPAPPADTAGPGIEPTWRDYPQYLGPDRDGTVPGVRLARDWSSAPPRPVWRRDVGAGWSGFAVAGDLAVTQEQRGDREVVTCYGLLDGGLRWLHADAARFESPNAGPGPRATPTIDGGRVVTLGGTGRLNCLELATGRLLWSRDAVAENGASVNKHGTSCSPLVLDGRVIVSVGGPQGRGLVAYDLESGAPLWSGGDDRAGYSSPVLAELAGVPQVLCFNASSTSAHDPDTGEVLWRTGWSNHSANIAQPLVLAGDRVLVSAGYGTGCALYAVRAAETGGLEVERLWRNLNLKSKFSNPVQHGGLVYGLDEGVLTCLDPETGQRRWKGGRYGHGQLLVAGDLLLLTSEFGELVLLEPSPDEPRELARFQALDDKTWNTSALAAPYLLVRNDLEAACYELPLAD